MSLYREEQIVYETKSHWVLEVKPGYFEVNKTGITHSTRCAIIGPYNEPGRARRRAIEECDRRTAADIDRMAGEANTNLSEFKAESCKKDD